MASAVVPIGFESIVRHAPETQVGRGVLAALRPGLNVRELEPARFVAAPTVFADEAAASAIARPYLAAYGYVEPTPSLSSTSCGVRVRARFAAGLGGSRLGGSRLGRDARLALVHLSPERVERAFDDRGGIAVRDLVREQILKLVEPVLHGLAEGDLELEAAGCRQRSFGRAVSGSAVSLEDVCAAGAFVRGAASPQA